MGTLTRTSYVDTLTCGNCGILFGLERSFMQSRMGDGNTFRCPNGCTIGYSDTKEQRLQRELDAARSLAARESKRRQTAEAERAAARGEVQHLRHRIGNGVCPCCSRTFQNLGEHIAGEHPEWRLEEHEPNPTLTFDRLSPNQQDHVRSIGRYVDLGDRGMPVPWGHLGTLNALERRGVVTIEPHTDPEDGWETELAVPTLTGLRLIGAAVTDG